jgi:hypothetical protein
MKNLILSLDVPTPVVKSYRVTTLIGRYGRETCSPSLKLFSRVLPLEMYLM